MHLCITTKTISQASVVQMCITHQQPVLYVALITHKQPVYVALHTINLCYLWHYTQTTCICVCMYITARIAVYRCISVHSMHAHVRIRVWLLYNTHKGHKTQTIICTRTQNNSCDALIAAVSPSEGPISIQPLTGKRHAISGIHKYRLAALEFGHVPQQGAAPHEAHCLAQQCCEYQEYNHDDDWENHVGEIGAALRCAVAWRRLLSEAPRHAQ
jgi:hypothetical protein